MFFSIAHLIAKPTPQTCKIGFLLSTARHHFLYHINIQSPKNAWLRSCDLETVHLFRTKKNKMPIGAPLIQISTIFWAISRKNPSPDFRPFWESDSLTTKLPFWGSHTWRVKVPRVSCRSRCGPSARWPQDSAQVPTR